MKPVDHQILRLALPCIVTNATVPLLGLCDVAIMGHVGGATHIGAINVGSMIFNVIYWLFGFLRMGTSGMTSQCLGARRLDDAAQMLQRSLLVALSIGAVIVALQWPIGRWAFWLMRPTADVEILCTPYYNICVWGAPAMLGLYALSGWFIGMQNTRLPMVVAVVQNVVNIGASLVLVLGLKMKVEGVALGTVIAQWCGFALALGLTMRYYGRFLHRRSMPLKGIAHGLGRFFRLNLDIFLRTICLVAVNLYFTSAGAALGAAILAANAVLMQFFILFSYMMDGFAYAGEALCGRTFGARNIAALRTTVRHLLGWGGFVMVLFTLLYLIGGIPFLHLLTTDNTVVDTASTYLPWAVLIPLTSTAAFIFDGVFIGLTATRGMLVSCFVATLAFFALYFLLRPLMDNHALWLALLVYLFIRGAVQAFIYVKKTAQYTLVCAHRRQFY